MNWSWMTNPNVLAQEGHFLLGCVLTLASQVYFGIPWWGAGAAIAYMIPKEVWLDPLTEKDPFFWDGAMDLGFLSLGSAVAIGISLLGK